MKTIDRRHFCKQSINTAIAFSIPGLMTSCKADTDSNNQQGPAIELPPGDEINALVSAIKGDKLGAMTRDAIEAVGGMKSIVNSGETVFIKPNFVTFPWASSNNCFHAGEVTKTEIIIATAEECLRAGADRVIIGDGSHQADFNWQYALTLDGTTDLVAESTRLNKEYSGTVVLACLENDSQEWIDVPSVTSHNKIAISGLVANADKVISIPVAKTHSWAQLTLGTKNFIGITPLAKYAQLVDGAWYNRGSFDHSSPRSISQVFLDIVKGIKPALTIIDFSIGLEGNGPTRDNGGTTIDLKNEIGSWAIIASTDIMAADATAARIMNHDVLKMEQLTMGFYMELGEIREESIEITGEKIENLQTPWKSARLM